MAVSNVAPPHISRLNKFGVRWLTASATFTRSYVRTRVASSDWCASRIVVSVNISRFCFRTHSANFSAPSSVSLSFVPGGGLAPRERRHDGSGSTRFGSTFPFTSGRPLTITSPR
jgi:hypothetical protein